MKPILFKALCAALCTVLAFAAVSGCSPAQTGSGPADSHGQSEQSAVSLTQSGDESSQDAVETVTSVAEPSAAPSSGQSAAASSAVSSRYASSAASSKPTSSASTSSAIKPYTGLAANGIFSTADNVDASALEALFAGKKVKAADRQTSIGDHFWMHFPDFVWVGNEIWAYYIKNVKYGPGDTDYYSTVGRATSRDGRSFVDKGIVLEPSKDANAWDHRFASFPGIWYENGTFYMVYEGAAATGDICAGAIGLATSKDGKTFTKYNGDGLLLDYDRKGFELANIGTPDLIHVNGVWYLTYHGFNGADVQIALASGTDLYHLKKCEKNPIIPASKTGADSGTCGRRDVIYVNGWYYMVYEICDGNPPFNNSKWGHKFARSKDMINWETAEAPYPLTSKDMGNDGPAFCVIDGKIWIYIRLAGNTTLRYTLKIAE